MSPTGSSAHPEDAEENSSLPRTSCAVLETASPKKRTGKRWGKSGKKHATATTSATIVSHPPLGASKPAGWLIHPIWLVLAVSTAAMFMSGPGQSYSVAAFIDPMLADLHLERTAFTTAYMVATLISGFSLPFAGQLLDRLGARVAVPVVGFCLALSCWWMSRVEYLAGLYAGFALVRVLGQGSLTLISTWMVGQWFERRRGLAMAIVGFGGTLSVMLVPQFNELLIQAYGWRTAWTVMGLVVGVVLVVPGALWVRSRPEDIGLGPDGRAEPEPQVPKSEIEAVHEHPRSHGDFTTWDAVRTPAFWKVLAVPTTSACIGTGLVFHIVSLLSEKGLERGAALSLLAVQAIVATVVGFVAGYLTDRWPARYLLAAAMCFLGSAILLLWLMPAWPALTLLYAALLGCHGGVIRSTGSVVWVNYFGRRHQGSVQGMAVSVQVLGAAVGPVPFALIQEATGSYAWALAGSLFFPVVAGLLVVSAKPPELKRIEGVAVPPVPA